MSEKSTSGEKSTTGTAVMLKIALADTVHELNEQPKYYCYMLPLSTCEHTYIEGNNNCNTLHKMTL
jgi:hypothetical protein